MADLLTNFMDSVFGSEGYLRNAQHATRLYRNDNFYDYAPKAGWMYYVVVKINTDVDSQISALPGGAAWAKRSMPFVGILAKSVDRPKFTIGNEVLNQYNRKTIVQTKISYAPISISWHDDQGNATSKLWELYYQYYYADSRYKGTSNQFSGVSRDPAFADTKFDTEQKRYGFNTAHESRFFDQIEIYQMNRQKYYCTTLVNPIITGWDSSSLDQTQGSRMSENRMTVAYESVNYTSGQLKKANVNFKDNHYDTTPSPLAVGGGGGIFGAIAGAGDLFDQISSLDENSSPLDYLKAGISAANLAKNVSKITAQSIKAEAYSVLAGGLNSVASGGRADLTTSVENFTSGIANSVNPGAVDVLKRGAQAVSTINANGKGVSVN